MVVRVQTVARDCMCDDAAQREWIIIRALKKMLIGMRIGDERRALTRELRTECRTLEASEPQVSHGHLRIRPAQHFKRQVSNKLRQRHGRIRDEVTRTVAATLFAAETDEVDRAARTFAGRECAGELQHSDATGSIVVSAVEDLVASERLIDAEVVQVSTQHDRFARLRTSQHTNRVPGGALLARWNDARVERHALHVSFSAVGIGVAAWFESKL